MSAKSDARSSAGGLAVTDATIVPLEPSGRLQRLCEVLRERAPVPGQRVEDRRSSWELAAARLPLADGTRRRPVDAGGVPAEWVEPPLRNDRTILYLHGGGYTMGSLATIRPLLSQIGAVTGSRLLSVDYRLAPEHQFPAAVEDAVAAYRWLLGEGFEPSDVVVAGDSAGGGLAVSTLLAARADDLPMPAAVICLSPWTDLTLSGASLRSNEVSDPDVRAWGLAEMADLYLGGQPRTEPLASPALGDLTGLPRMLIHVGTAEVLLDDSIALADAARRFGVEVTLELYQDMIHVWHGFAPGLPEGTAAIERLARWLEDR